MQSTKSAQHKHKNAYETLHHVLIFENLIMSEGWNAGYFLQIDRNGDTRHVSLRSSLNPHTYIIRAEPGVSVGVTHGEWRLHVTGMSILVAWQKDYKWIFELPPSDHKDEGKPIWLSKPHEDKNQGVVAVAACLALYAIVVTLAAFCFHEELAKCRKMLADRPQNPSGPPGIQADPTVMRRGDVLKPGGPCLKHKASGSTLCVSADCRILYNGEPFVHTIIPHTRCDGLKFQHDSNLVLYANGNPRWASETDHWDGIDSVTLKDGYIDLGGRRQIPLLCAMMPPVKQK
jgi:hypothetical protein